MARWWGAPHRGKLGELADALGLHASTDQRAWGYYKGIEVQVRHQLHTRQSSHDWDTHYWRTYFEAMMPYPLQLGCWIGGGRSHPPYVTGDPAFDRVLAFRGYEAEDMRAFLKSPDFRDSLVRAAREVGLRQLTDSMVELRAGGRIWRLSTIRNRLEWLVTLVRNAQLARTHLGNNTRAERLARTWRSFARKGNHALDETNLLLNVHADEHRVRLLPERHRTGWYTRFTVELGHPVGLELSLRKDDTLMPRWLSGVQDITVGDEAFDEAFLVGGTPAERGS